MNVDTERDLPGEAALRQALADTAGLAPAAPHLFEQVGRRAVRGTRLRVAAAAVVVVAVAAGIPAGLAGHGGGERAVVPVTTPTPADGPRTLRTPVDLRQVLEQHASNGAGCPAGQIPDQDGANCYLLAPTAIRLTHVADIGVDDAGPNPSIQIGFDPADQARFADLTGRIIGQQLAVVVGGRVVTAPVVQDRIVGDASIAGTGDMRALLREITG